VLARFNRLDGKHVMFLTGTDEHGQKVEQSATRAGKSPQEFADQIAAKFIDLAKQMNLSNDDFIRTTEPRHKSRAQAFWKRLVESGNIYEGKYAGWYDPREEAFVGDDELVTTSDGKKLSPDGNECSWVEEASYFFRLSAWQDKLLELYERNPGFIEPSSRRNEVLSFVKAGLKDLSISRTSFAWGIPVPDDAKHVMYVWIDALANYITALGYPEQNGKFSEFWPADIHMVGKGIIRFHAVYWPAFLMAAGLPLPKRIYGHGYWTVEGQKMSKSIGNVIAPADLIQTYGLDQTRFFLLRAFPFGNDGDFSRKAMIERINADLANGLGNLAQRTLSQVAKNCEGRLPAADPLTPEDTELLEAARALPRIMRQELAMPAFHKALDAAFDVISRADIYIDHQAPWTLRKTDPARMAVVLGVLCRVLRDVGTCLQPFMPDSMGALLTQLGVPEDQRTLAALDTPLAAGTAMPAPQGLFPRYVEPDAA
jgi:methionyl-tRNA synthetase